MPVTLARPTGIPVMAFQHPELLGVLPHSRFQACLGVPGCDSTCGSKIRSRPRRGGTSFASYFGLTGTLLTAKLSIIPRILFLSRSPKAGGSLAGGKRSCVLMHFVMYSTHLCSVSGQKVVCPQEQVHLVEYGTTRGNCAAGKEKL